MGFFDGNDQLARAIEGIFGLQEPFRFGDVVGVNPPGNNVGRQHVGKHVRLGTELDDNMFPRFEGV